MSPKCEVHPPLPKTLLIHGLKFSRPVTLMKWSELVPFCENWASHPEVEWQSIQKNYRVLCVWVATTLLHGMAGYCLHQTMDCRVIGQLASKSATLPDDETMTNAGYRFDWWKSYGIWEQGLAINETDPPTLFPSSACVFSRRPSSNVWYGLDITHYTSAANRSARTVNN
jgi:hypothetical protein